MKIEILAETLKNNKTILAFHIGRGGRFYNSGFLSFLGEKNISEFTEYLFLKFENQSKLYNIVKNYNNLLTKYYECSDNDDFSFFEEKLKFEMGKKVFFTSVGHKVGLSEVESDSGIGAIDIDESFDTTYTSYACELNDKELKLLLNYTGFLSNGISSIINEINEVEEDN